MLKSSFCILQNELLQSKKSIQVLHQHMCVSTCVKNRGEVLVCSAEKRRVSWSRTTQLSDIVRSLRSALHACNENVYMRKVSRTVHLGMCSDGAREHKHFLIVITQRVFGRKLRNDSATILKVYVLIKVALLHQIHINQRSQCRENQIIGEVNGRDGMGKELSVCLTRFRDRPCTLCSIKIYFQLSS